MEITRLYFLDTEKLQTAEMFQKYFSTVSEYRQKKIMAFYFQKDRALSLGAGILLNRGLKEYGLKEKDMQYLLNANEKPSFTHYPEIHFNISHSGRYVICALGTAEVGCDIEEITDIDLDIARKFFYYSEYEYISNQKNAADRQQAFFRLWTLKESFMKTTGYGMSLPLDAFRIYFEKDQIKVSQKTDSRSYYFHEYSCVSNYKIACCSQSSCFDDNVVVCYL